LLKKPEVLPSAITVEDIFPDFVQILHILRILAGDWMLDAHTCIISGVHEATEQYHLQDKQ
jgi:hypothetical protein